MGLGLASVSPAPPYRLFFDGALAHLVERLLCKQEVTGSSPVGSTMNKHVSQTTTLYGWFFDAYTLHRTLMQQMQELSDST